MTHKNTCEYKGKCPFVNGRLRRCGFLTDKEECHFFQEQQEEQQMIDKIKYRFFVKSINGCCDCELIVMDVAQAIKDFEDQMDSVGGITDAEDFADDFEEWLFEEYLNDYGNTGGFGSVVIEMQPNDASLLNIDSFREAMNEIVNGDDKNG